MTRRKFGDSPFASGQRVPNNKEEFLESMGAVIGKIDEAKEGNAGLQAIANAAMKRFVSLADDDELFNAKADETTYEALSTLDLSDGEDVFVTVKFPMNYFDALMEILCGLSNLHADDLPLIAEMYAKMKVGMLSNIHNVLSASAVTEMQKIMDMLRKGLDNE